MYRRLRLARIIFSLLFLAAVTYAIIDVAFDLTIVGKWILHTQLVPAILAGTAGWIVLWLVLTMSFGRVYCSTVCPLGTVQDLAARCGRMARRNHRYRYHPSQDMVRIAVPVAVGVCLFFGFMPAVTYTDPYTLYSRIVLGLARIGYIGAGSLVAAIVLLLAISALAWRRGRLFCNTLCPAGGLLGFLSRQPIYRVDINTDKCIHCGKCEDVCKSECINLSTCVVDNTRCVMCMDCTSICPNDAITVRRGRYRLSTPLMQQASMQCGTSKNSAS